MKNTLLICTGLSGSGKTYFIQNTLPAGLFYNLRSATTRPMRLGESEGNPYFFRDESYFENTRLATRLWVNQSLWKPGEPKWMYGVPEAEIFEHLGQNLVYDVIEPKYAQQMIKWFKCLNLDRRYNFRVAYFLTPEANLETARSRANMSNDTAVRTMNTCNPEDFLNAGLDIDYILKPRDGKMNPRLAAHIKRLQRQR